MRALPVTPRQVMFTVCGRCPSLHAEGLTAIGLLPGGSGYFTCKQNMKLVTNKFKSGGLNEKHVVATWNVGNRPSVCL